jgi:hypothetical protein
VVRTFELRSTLKPVSSFELPVQRNAMAEELVVVSDKLVGADGGGVTGPVITLAPLRFGTNFDESE